MKNYFILFLLLISIHLGCLPIQEENSRVSFYSDINLNDSPSELFINDKFVGTIYPLEESPSCGDSLLLEIPILDDGNMVLSLMDKEGESIDLGIINLYSVTHGLFIKPSRDSALYVRHDLDAPCSLVRLHW